MATMSRTMSVEQSVPHSPQYDFEEPEAAAVYALDAPNRVDRGQWQSAVLIPAANLQFAMRRLLPGRYRLTALDARGVPIGGAQVVEVDESRDWAAVTPTTPLSTDESRAVAARWRSPELALALQRIAELERRNADLEHENAAHARRSADLERENADHVASRDAMGARFSAIEMELASIQQGQATEEVVMGFLIKRMAELERRNQ